MSAVQRLRAETAAAHDAVDAAYAAYDLTDRASYRAFLLAHARALPAVERALAGASLPAWRERITALAADLAELDAALPDPLPLAAPTSEAAGWGMLYVIEGSRLGGVLLERQVAPGLPRNYLASRHLSGEWRNFLAALDAALLDEDRIAEAVTAARNVFDLYGLARQS